ncbi:hypothetical protein DICSQDRAFT_183214 [Dichomitus squalens LYAD-421 SS1]|uniref:Uncharacterized protein n=1 Tax=Dichomitus squalens (strain LYAD-421) TaxID=732165 RepID=R7SMT6_DICSQ|nr:uncharacterized protein DICSQDRAFT_183214 [Dichomitus squalens LYAD-421 SS1]EJF57499.1 hypothetical protein DICSQDRAFT_183214 [Dichomitus squalens LYAD-421 SS1]
MLRSALRTHLQAPKLSYRQYARNPRPSSPRPPRKEVYLLKPRSLINIFLKHSPHPSLALIAPALTPPLEQGSSDDANSQGDNEWLHIVQAPNLASALDHVDHILSTEAAQSQSPSPASVLPTSVIFSVLSKPPSTAYEAFAATLLALNHPQASHELFPLVHLLSAYWLANFALYAPLHSVVLRLIYAKNEPQSLHVALMLRILAQVKPANELQPMMALLLDVATRRHLDLGVRTYRAILENPATTGYIAKKVEQHMEARGYSPNLSHSHAFVRIYGLAGKRTVAARFWRRIRHGEYYGRKAEYVNDSRSQALLLEGTLRASKKPKQVSLYIKYLLETTARAVADPTVRQSDQTPMLPGPSGIPKKVFMAALRVMANNLRIPSRHLLSILRSGLESLGGGTKRLWCYSVVIKGLLKRAEYDEAAGLLEEIWEERDKFSAPETTVAVEALTMAGRPDAAFRLLLSLVPERDIASGTSRLGPGDNGVLLPRTYAPAAKTIDTHAVNSFMVSLLRIGRLDAVFFIWDTMPRLFRVEPDSVSLAIVLKAARYARKNEGALQVAIADFGLGRVLPRKVQAAHEDWTNLGKDEAKAALQALLATDEKRTGTAFWRGERAGAVALRIASEVLTTNWPELRGFTAPFQAVRRNAGEQATSPMSDLLHSFASHPGDDAPVEAAYGHLYHEEQRLYFGIVPEDDMFRAWFDLLAEEDGAAQIPLILTWMRYLKVRPSRDTLATALVHWGEVTFEGPWIQRLRGGESQYIKLLKWITKWVGRENVPGRNDTQKALMRVKWFRELGQFRAKRVADIAKERFNL